MLITGLMGFEPVLTEAGISHEGNSHMEGVLHLFEDDVLHLFLLIRIDAEVEFIVYLENHLALDAFSLETIEDMNHSHLDDVCGSALNRGIDGITFCMKHWDGYMFHALSRLNSNRLRRSCGEIIPTYMLCKEPDASP